MKILVTGATGFIGNYVITNLLSLQNTKIIATSLNKSEVVDKEWINSVEYIEYDITKNEKELYRKFNKPDYLIHLAWQGLPNYNDLIHFEKNLFYHYEFIKNLIQGGLQKVSVVGTCFEYGMVNGCLSEDMITNPNNAYGIAKDTLRKCIDELKKKYSFNYNWIRLFYLYGKGQSEKSLIAQLDKAIENNEKIFNMSGGEQLRDFLPVEKVAEYLIKISLQKTIHGIVNCCSGTAISVRQLVENYLQNHNAKISLNLGYYPYPDYEPMAFWGATSKRDLAVQAFDKEFKL